MACEGFDGQVVRFDPVIKDLMDKFICVRIIQANGMDLSLFQFDYDLTFAAFFMNADGTIYGRYGTRSDQKEATRDISMEGFRKALLGALQLHNRHAEMKAVLSAKRGDEPKFATPEQFPTLAGKFTSTIDMEGEIGPSCIHCHMVRNAERRVYRDAGEQLPESLLFPWPMPDTIGLSLDPKEKATVVRVRPDSQADAAGFEPGDEILLLEGQPIISIADVQWVLQQTSERALLEAGILRDGAHLDLSVRLDEGWRRQGNLSWRETTWDLRRMVLGGMVLDPIPVAQRHRLGLADDVMALRVRHVGQFGEHAVAKRAGVKRGDIVTSFDGKSENINETALLVHLLTNIKRGNSVPITVRRGDRKLEMQIKMQ